MRPRPREDRYFGRVFYRIGAGLPRTAPARRQAMHRPDLTHNPARAGPQATGYDSAEHQARERTRETAYRPDGSVAGVREREFWHVWRQPAVAALPRSSTAMRAGLWETIKEFAAFFFGLHALVGIAVAGGALCHWVGWNPLIGYVAVFAVVYIVLVNNYS